MNILKRYLLALTTLLMLPAIAWAEVNVSTFEDLQTALSSSESIINITADITNASELAISRDVTIDGKGHTISVPTPYLNEDGTKADNPSSNGVFTISSGRTVNLKNMTVMGGKFADENTTNAAIYNLGTLTLDHVTMTRSHRGLSNSGSGAVAVLTNCVLIRNEAKYGGGLLNEEHGHLVMDCCSFSENRTWEWGGGAAENRKGGKMYMNNVTMSNNYCDELGTINNNNSAAGTNTYIMNSTITGNVSTYPNGAVALNQVGGQVYVVNSIITDNKYLNSNNLEDIDVAGGNYAYCVVGSNNGGTLDENCKLTPSDEVFQSYAENGLYTGSGTTPTFSHTTLIESNGQFIAPVSPDGPAASGGTSTYFSYTLDPFEVKMSYDSNGTNTPLGDLPVSEDLVTTNQDGTPRATTAPIPIGSAEISSVNSTYYTVTRGSFSHGTMTGVSAYGDSYVSGTYITVTATPASGYVLAGWEINGSIQSTNNPYTFALTENTEVTPVFSSATTTIVCSIEGYEGQFNGNPHSITVNVTTPASGYTITYSTTENGTYTTMKPTFTQIGTYTVYFKITASNYADFSGSAIVKITQSVSATDITVADIAYDASAHNTRDALTLKYGNQTFINTNYMVEPAIVTEAGTYTLNITGRDLLTGTRTATLRVTKALNGTYTDDIVISATDDQITSIPTQIYDGANAVHPTFFIFDNGMLLTPNVDYTVSYGANNTEGSSTGSVIITGAGVYSGSKTFTFAIVNEDFTEGGIAYHVTSSTTVSVGTKDHTVAISTATTEVTITSPITHQSFTFQVTGVENGAFTGCSKLRYIDLTSIIGYTPSTLERTIAASPFYSVPKQALVYLNGAPVTGENYVYKLGDGDFRCHEFRIYDDTSGSQKGFTGDDYKWSLKNIYPFTARNIVNTRNLVAGQHYTAFLPYNLPIPADMEAYELAGANSAKNIVGFKEVTTGTLTRFTPYVVITSKTGQSLGTTNATVPIFDENESGTVTKDDITLNGSMKYISGDDANGYYVMQSGNTWKQISGSPSYSGACILPMRAYISGGSSGARSYFKASFTDAAGNTTAIDQLQLDDDLDGAVYDLQGRRVQSPQYKGIYIKNGRKVIR